MLKFVKYFACIAVVLSAILVFVVFFVGFEGNPAHYLSLGEPHEEREFVSQEALESEIKDFYNINAEEETTETPEHVLYRQKRIVVLKWCRAAHNYYF